MSLGSGNVVYPKKDRLVKILEGIEQHVMVMEMIR